MNDRNHCLGGATVSSGNWHTRGPPAARCVSRCLETLVEKEYHVYKRNFCHRPEVAWKATRVYCPAAQIAALKPLNGYVTRSAKIPTPTFLH